MRFESPSNKDGAVAAAGRFMAKGFVVSLIYCGTDKFRLI